MHRPRGCSGAYWRCACRGMYPGHTVLLLPLCRASPGYWGANVPFACGWGQQTGTAGSLAGRQLPGLHPACRAGSSAGHRFHGVFSSPAIIILLQVITAHNNNQAAAGCWFVSSGAVAPSPACPELGESLRSSPFCPSGSAVCPTAAAPGAGCWGGCGQRAPASASLRRAGGPAAGGDRPLGVFSGAPRGISPLQQLVPLAVCRSASPAPLLCARPRRVPCTFTQLLLQDLPAGLRQTCCSLVGVVCWITTSSFVARPRRCWRVPARSRSHPRAVHSCWNSS